MWESQANVKSDAAIRDDVFGASVATVGDAVESVIDDSVEVPKIDGVGIEPPVQERVMRRSATCV